MIFFSFRMKILKRIIVIIIKKGIEERIIKNSTTLLIKKQTSFRRNSFLLIKEFESVIIKYGKILIYVAVIKETKVLCLN